MSDPRPLPLDDNELGMLLGRHPSPPLGAGFADRVLAEAQRADRARALPIAPPPRRSVRRWTRRGIWSGIVAVNLIVASAIAAAVGGGAIHLSHVVDVVAQALHVRHHAAAPHPLAVVHRAPVARPVVAVPIPTPAAAPVAAPAAPPAAVMAAPIAIPARAPIGRSGPASVAMPALRPPPARAAPIRREDHALATHRRERIVRPSDRPERLVKADAPDRPRLTAERDRPLHDEGTARANLAAREAMAAPLAQPAGGADRASTPTARAEQQAGQTSRTGAQPQGWRQQAWRQRQQAWQQRYQAWQQRQQQPGRQAQGAQAGAEGGTRAGNPNPTNQRPGGWRKNKPAGGKGLRRGLGRRRP